MADDTWVQELTANILRTVAIRVEEIAVAQGENTTSILLLEGGDFILLEGGDAILLEANNG